MLRKFLFPSPTMNSCVSTALLILRIVFGGMLMIHGWGKLSHFNEYATSFMMGSTGLGLAVFAEFFCAFAIIVGFFHRLAIIPLVINMSVAFFVVHKAVLIGDGSGEMALLYLAVFVALLIAGSGKYSVDAFLAKPDKK